MKTPTTIAQARNAAHVCAYQHGAWLHVVLLVASIVGAAAVCLPQFAPTLPPALHFQLFIGGLLVGIAPAALAELVRFSPRPYALAFCETFLVAAALQALFRSL